MKLPTCSHVIFYLKFPTFYVRNICNLKYLNCSWKGTENEILRFWGISNKNAITIKSFWFKCQHTPSNVFWGISYFLPSSVFLCSKYMFSEETISKRYLRQRWAWNPWDGVFVNGRIYSYIYFQIVHFAQKIIFWLSNSFLFVSSRALASYVFFSHAE